MPLLTFKKDKRVTTEHNVRLTSSELGLLWTQYMNDSLGVCVSRYFVETCEDQEMIPLAKYALSLSQKHLKVISEIFSHENMPLPIGFTDSDVNVEAPKLFSDTFILFYLKNMAVIGMASAGVALGVCARSDVSDLFKEILASASALHDKLRMIALSKGVFIRPPYISLPERPDFVTKQSFLLDFIGKQKRPLSSIEITHLFINSQTNALGKALMMAFAQVCKSEDAKQFFLKGKQIADKHIKKFGQKLLDENLPAPMIWDAQILDTTVAPFSDKLMVFHTTGMIAVGIGNYGTAAGTCQRLDLSALYAKLSTEIAMYAAEGAKLMIKHGWLEEPPHTADREALINKPK